MIRLKMSEAFYMHQKYNKIHNSNEVFSEKSVDLVFTDFKFLL